MLQQDPGPRLPTPEKPPASGMRRDGDRSAALSFGGVAFELNWASGGDLDLYEVEREACLPPGTGPVAAHVQCNIDWRHDDVLAPLHVMTGLTEGELCRFRGLGTAGTLRRHSPGHYTATLHVAPTIRGGGAALRALAGLVLEAEGGLCLHAAALEVDGGAVLFLGPSGAGKSTACNLSGGRALAYDHVAVMSDDAGGYWAWRIPLGEPSALPLTGSPVLPLRGVLRVVHGGGMPEILPVDAARALFDVRAAVDVADPGPALEAIRLFAAERLCGRVPVARVATVLGQPLFPVISRWLQASGDARG